MTHTPGPWRMTADPYEDGTPYFCVEAGDEFGEGDAMGFRFRSIMREADARLIAAAPDLLAAAERVLADATKLPRSTCFVIGHDALAELDALIAPFRAKAVP